MRYKTNQIISFEEYLYWQNMGLPYTGFVKGKGYTFPYYSPMEMPLVENNRVQWNTWINHPVRTQIWDTSPLAIFRSMDYSPEDIINHIKKDNGDGTVTYHIGMDKIIVSSDPNKHDIYVHINKSSETYEVSIYILDKEHNQYYFKKVTNNENVVNSVNRHYHDKSDNIFIGLGDYNTKIGLITGVAEIGLNPVVKRIHPLRPIYYSDGPIYRPALPGYNVGPISGKFIENSFKYLKKIGIVSSVLGFAYDWYDYKKGNISLTDLFVNVLFTGVGLISLPGAIISTAYTIVDEYYPNGWEGVFKDYSKNIYEMYMNQVNESGIMMAPWIMGK